MYISTCIGKVGVNDISKFVNKIKDTNEANITYNFIAIREFLQVISQRNIVDTSKVEQIFGILVLNSKNTNEKIRTLSGECLGKLNNY